MAVVGLLSPGEMGAFVGDVMVDAGAEVLWAGDGRSAATASRARRFRDVGTIEALVGAADVVVSVCPPGSALEVARQVAAVGFQGHYLDANAVSPATVGAIVAALPQATVVDGCIIGPPRPRDVVIHLAGAEAERVATLFAGDVLEARVLHGRPCGAASALKASYATATKAFMAMLWTAAASAEHYGVYDELMANWAALDPTLPAKIPGAGSEAARKAWRFVAEMTEAADTMREAGLPDGYWRAAAETYRRLS